jgi:hypothetical protein
MHIRCVCLIVILFFYLCAPLATQELINDGIKIEVISVSVLSREEARKRSPDFIDPDVVVRLRLSTSDSGLEVYTSKYDMIPASYRVQKEASNFVWLFGKGGSQKNASSPGIGSVLLGSKGRWVILPPRSAIEWEEIDFTSFAGEKHAFTIYIKQKSNQREHEVFSEVFVVPASKLIKTEIDIDTR